jgi:ubiquinone/menaquinone biosynthesis C-methylase UbiE
MKQGDFTELAEQYAHRPGYSEQVLNLLCRYTGALDNTPFQVADVGAGTGKLTEQLLALGLNCVAIEPNQAMREKGQEATRRYKIAWRAGSAEETGLESASVDWVLMASAFHWADAPRALSEFHRILKPGGFLSVLYNPRDIEKNPLQRAIEGRIKAIVPELKRVSSGSAQYTERLSDTLVSTGHFKDLIFVEGGMNVLMSKERYIGAWRSVNDIQSQAGPERFQKILTAIEEEIGAQEELIVAYKIRAWTVTRV